jgi:hypothetical protein
MSIGIRPETIAPPEPGRFVTVKAAIIKAAGGCPAALGSKFSEARKHRIGLKTAVYDWVPSLRRTLDTFYSPGYLCSTL